MIMGLVVIETKVMLTNIECAPRGRTGKAGWGGHWQCKEWSDHRGGWWRREKDQPTMVLCLTSTCIIVVVVVYTSITSTTSLHHSSSSSLYFYNFYYFSALLRLAPTCLALHNQSPFKDPDCWLATSGTSEQSWRKKSGKFLLFQFCISPKKNLLAQCQ